MPNALKVVLRNENYITFSFSFYTESSLCRTEVQKFDNLLGLVKRSSKYIFEILVTRIKF